MYQKYRDYTVRAGEKEVVEGLFDAQQRPVTIRITGAYAQPPGQPVVAVPPQTTIAEVESAPGTTAMVNWADLTVSPGVVAMTVEPGHLSDILASADKGVLWSIPNTSGQTGGDLTITVPGKYSSTADHLLVLGVGGAVAESARISRTKSHGLHEGATGPLPGL